VNDENRLEALITRLDVGEARLAGLSRVPFPQGETDPDPGAEETWDAAQVWAHIAEFVSYWTDQARDLVSAPAGTSPNFGRVKTDPGRIDAIARDRSLPREKLWQKVHDGIEASRTYFSGLTTDQLEQTGVHPTRGTVDVAFILEQFVVKHLEEHADQLDKLSQEVAGP
jgi:DinB superfamily